MYRYVHIRVYILYIYMLCNDEQAIHLIIINAAWRRSMPFT